MLLSMMKISPPSGKHLEVIDILLSVRGPTLAATGCRQCCIFLEQEDGDVFYLEEWQSWGEMIAHIRSPLYARIIRSLELSERPPQIVFHQVAGSHGIELIETMRSFIDHGKK